LRFQRERKRWHYGLKDRVAFDEAYFDNDPEGVGGNAGKAVREAEDDAVRDLNGRDLVIYEKAYHGPIGGWRCRIENAAESGEVLQAGSLLFCTASDAGILAGTRCEFGRACQGESIFGRRVCFPTTCVNNAQVLLRQGSQPLHSVVCAKCIVEWAKAGLEESHFRCLACPSSLEAQKLFGSESKTWPMVPPRG
jgi:hypothetical protein